MNVDEQKAFAECVRRAEDRYNEMIMNPDVYSKAERDEIALDAQACAALADAVMKEDFATLSPENQDKLLDLLALESGLSRSRWEDMLT